MKIVQPSDATVQTGNNLRLGIVRLGRAAGKTKYALLDEDDIKLVEQFAFEAKVEVDPNGMGACVYAFAYDIKKGRASGQYVHTLLWEMHRGGIASGFKVVHLNNVTVDNRLDNLALVPVGATRTGPQPLKAPPPPSPQEKERCLYWVAIAQLPVDPLEEYSLEVRERVNSMGPLVRTCLNRNGEIEQVSEDELSGLSQSTHFCYYECRYPPCTQMEQHMRQFSICGRCQEARYCGTFCQQRDWPVHKKTCQPKQRATPLLGERPPER